MDCITCGYQKRCPTDRTRGVGHQVLFLFIVDAGPAHIPLECKFLHSRSRFDCDAILPKVLLAGRIVNGPPFTEMRDPPTKIEVKVEYL